MTAPLPIYASRPLRPALAELLAKLQPGQRLQVTQTVRVGLKSWTTTVAGTFRHVDSLATGLATDRVARDDIVVPLLHMTKENGEMTTIALDENTKVEVVGG